MRYSARADRLSRRVAGRQRSTGELTALIAASFVSRNQTAVTDVAPLLASISAAMTGLSVAPTVATTTLPQRDPAVPIRKSITDEYIVCLEDGLKFKSMKRHLRAKYDLSPDQYRVRWGLGADYPMVAPAYSARRTQLAKDSGLGRRDETPAVSAPEAQPLSVRIAETFVDGDKGIVCLTDSRVVKDLGRHLRRHFDQSADQYRAQYGLPDLYPMKVERIARFLAGQS